MRNREKILFALNIVTGRVEDSLSFSEYDLLGYDSYKFSYYGKPSPNEVRTRCRDIILDYLEELDDRLTKLERKDDD